MSAQNTHFAVMVKTRLADTTNAVIGLYNSVLCLITGRPEFGLSFSGAGASYVSAPELTATEFTLNVNGLTPAIIGSGLSFDLLGDVPVTPPNNPVTNEPQLVWKQGVLTPDGIGEPEEFFDYTLGGGYSTTSGVNLAWMNNLPGLSGETLFRYLKAAGIDLFGCEVQVFVVIDGVFKQFQQNQIQGITNGEHDLGSSCRDAARMIHKPVLKTEVTVERFPDAPEDSRGKFLPLTIGRVPEAELLPVTGEVVRQMLVTAGGVDYEAAKITFRTSAVSFTILVGEKDYTVGGALTALVGKYVRVVRPGISDEEYSPSLITSATNGGGPSTQRLVILTIDKAFRTKDGVSTLPGLPTTFQDAWYVQVYGLSSFGVVADATVSEISGPLLGYADPQFVDIEAKRIESYADGTVEYPDYAGITSRPEGDFSPFQPQIGFLISAQNSIRGPVLRSDSRIPALSNFNVGEVFPKCRSSATVASVSVSKPYPATLSSLPILYDRLGTDYYEKAAGFTVVEATDLVLDGVIIDIPLPEGFVLESDETLSVGIVGEFSFTNAPAINKTFDVRLQSYLLDVYGQPCSSEALCVVKTESLGTTATHTSEVDTIGEFYFDGSGSGESSTLLDSEDPPAYFDLIRDAEKAKVARKIRVKLINSILIVGGNFNATPTFQLRHKLYQIALFRTKDSYEGKKYIAVTGAKFASTWGGRKTATDPVLTIPDTIEYLIRERDGSDLVETGSFDTVNFYRSDFAWWIGRQITQNTDQENTLNLVDNLCKMGFLAVVPGRDNRRRIINLDGYDAANRTLDGDDIIPGSMEEAQVTGLDRVYTGLELRYDKNPATGDYRSTVFVRKTEESTFPAEATLISGTTVPMWTTYAGGFAEYANGKAAWDSYHAAWLITRRENIYKLDCDWFQTRARVGIEGASEDSAVYLALVLSEWYSQPRKRYSFKLPLTLENLDLLLGDRVLFADVKRTGGLYYKAIIERIVLGTKEGSECLGIQVSHRFNDEGFATPEDAEPLFITEVVGGDTITEVVGITDTITEVVN